MQADGEQQGGGPLGGFGDWLGKHSNTLLAMGAGLLGAPTLAQGLSRGFAYAGPAGQADIARQTQLGGQQATYNALRTAGVPHDLAVAGATNPKVMDKLMESYVTGNKYAVHDLETTNSWGEKTKTPIVYDERDPSKAYYLQTGQPVNPNAGTVGPRTGTAVQGPNGVFTVQGGEGGGQAPAAAGGGQTGGAPAQAPSTFYAPGVSDENYREDLPPEDYIKQFTPSTQQAIKDRVNGLMPISAATGRGSGPAQRLQRAAELYGALSGTPMDSASVAQRREWATSIANTKSGVGLQAKGFQQGLEHMAALSDKWVKAHQSGGMNIEALARLRNRAITSKQTEIYNGIINDAGKVAGEVGKLFSSGGTGHERQETQALLGDTRMSGRAAAGAMESTLDLMMGGLRPLEGRRDQLFPAGNAPRGSVFMGPAEEANIAKIRKNLAILRGEPGAVPAAAAPAAAPTPTKPGGRYVYDPNTKTMVLQ
jgi:hypothetical protein